MSIAACLLAKDENEYINEWLSWHVSTGIDHFYIYDNDSKTKLVDSIEEQYEAVCTFIDWPWYTEDIQTAVYTHCLNNFGKLYSWITFIDTDEFINVKSGILLEQFMQDYIEYDGLYIGWDIYNASGQYYKQEGPVRERFTETIDYKQGFPNGKSIINPQRFKKIGPHTPFVSPKHNLVVENHQRIFSAYVKNFPRNLICLDHYYTKSYEEWIWKIKQRGDVDVYKPRKFEEFFLYNPDMKESDYHGPGGKQC